MIRSHLVAALVAIGVSSACSYAHGQTLRSLAERKDLKIGVMALDAAWNTPAQQALVSSEFNAVTVGTFWVRTHPARDSYNWSLTDNVVNWADGAGLDVKLHPLLYPANQHNPQWVLDSPHSEARAILEEFITTAMDRYRGVVDVWDVVNEAVKPSATGGMRDCWWLEALGPGYVTEAFRIARQHDPTATLVYNEHSIELNNTYQNARWTTTKEILTALKAENLVDGLGWQLHMTPEDALGGQLALAERMQWVKDLGLKNFVSELDLPIAAGDEALESQGAAYKRLAEIWLEHNNGGWFQTWGVTDKYSWLGADKRPLLFDELAAPKPAYEGVREALEAATSADFDGDGDVDGNDFLKWQRGEAGGGQDPSDLDPSDLESWQRQFPEAEEAGEPQSWAVPEPRSLAVCLVTLTCWRRDRLSGELRGLTPRS
jgi:endo-1,4-beta-xylanase